MNALGALTPAEKRKYSVGGRENTKSARDERRAVDYWLILGQVPPAARASLYVRNTVRAILRDREEGATR